MITGILETDIVDKNIRKQQGSYADMFQQLFLSVDSSIEFRVYRVIDGEYPDSLDECNAYVITGSKFSAYENIPWIE
ncbi:MAG TPA: GMP synthase, partial [Gammaproteobacteria bacterium]|nr:GMP synthase [Gammaproteobacteria bacterium]